jgi:hypothetical protein
MCELCKASHNATAGSDHVLAMGYHFPSGVIGSHVCLLEITRGQNL